MSGNSQRYRHSNTGALRSTRHKRSCIDSRLVNSPTGNSPHEPHDIIGHGNPSVVEDLVVADDMFCDLPYLAGVPKDPTTAALRILGYEDPWEL